MNDNAKTLCFVVVAALLGGVAVWTAPGSTRSATDRFDDQGQEFYPDFKDPAKAASLEVIAYDEQSGTATPFKVQYQNGLWSIPSHNDYPADGKERLANTAASIMDLSKDTVTSDRVEDHEALGVVDPLDEGSSTLKGRGQRITLRDESGGVLADYIVGQKVPAREGFHYLRLPGKKRTYASKAAIDLSTKFADWIETNLLNLTSNDVTRLEIRDYSVDEASGRVDDKDTIELTKADDSKWSIPDIAENQEVDQNVARRIPTSLSGIRITGVRPKPQSLTEDLRVGSVQLDLETQLSLTSKGFFVSKDGRLLSNEGEVEVGMKNGVSYTLRFGEVVFGEGLEISAGAEGDAKGAEPAGAEPAGDKSGPENRYLFVTVGFDESLLPPKPQPPAGYVPTSQQKPATQDSGQAQPAAPGGGESAGGAASGGGEAATPTGDQGAAELSIQDPAQTGDQPGQESAQDAQKAEEEARRQAEDYERSLKDWEIKAEEGRKAAAKLNERFAPWYYVISGQDFSKIKVQRSELVKEKKEEKSP